MKDELKTLAEQINFKELSFAGFKLAFSDEENLISISKGLKAITIKYDFGSDTYILRQIKFNNRMEITKEETFNNADADDLKEYIQNFFKFEYVMDRFKVSNDGEDSMLKSIKTNDKEMMIRLEQKVKAGEMIRLT